MLRPVLTKRRKTNHAVNDAANLDNRGLSFFLLIHSTLAEDQVFYISVGLDWEKEGLFLIQFLLN
jgi:hypothetical protein